MSRFNLRSWFRSRRPASVPRRRKLGFECCEHRRLLSIDPVVGVGDASDPVLPNVTELIEFDFATGIVTINGTDERDEVTIENDIEGDGASFGNFEVGIAVFNPEGPVSPVGAARPFHPQKGPPCRREPHRPAPSVQATACRWARWVTCTGSVAATAA